MIIRADARSIPLRDGCVQCVVTSPPYWGLRDYGTATWEGGDPACDHRQQLGGEGTASAKQNTSAGTQTMQYRERCERCGARRVDAQIGLEPTPDAYVQTMVKVFREVWRVLLDDGTVWLNLGDSYTHGGMSNPSGSSTLGGGKDRGASRYVLTHQTGKPKDLVGIPWRVAFALQADGWYLRSDIIWHKPNPMPESVTDRPTKAHEYLFLLSKRERYYYDADAITEDSGTAFLRAAREAKNGQDYQRGRGHTGRNDGALSVLHATKEKRNKRSVWTIPTLPYAGAHFATMPEALVTPCILAGCPLGGLVLDPFCGSGTVLAVAERLSRRAVGTDLSYQDLAKKRTAQRGLRW